MSFYVVHVVKRAFPGGGDEAGEWIQAEYDNATLADSRCRQLNQGRNLVRHHWWEVRESVEGLPKSYFFQDSEQPSS